MQSTYPTADFRLEPVRVSQLHRRVAITPAPEPWWLLAGWLPALHYERDQANPGSMVDICSTELRVPIEIIT